jgi:hypothetical protein
MSIGEKYWRAVLLTFLRYLSILMIISGVGFIIAGRIASPWFYMGLLSWPLFIMLGCVNLKYIYIINRVDREELKKTIHTY